MRAKLNTLVEAPKSIRGGYCGASPLPGRTNWLWGEVSVGIDRPRSAPPIGELCDVLVDIDLMELDHDQGQFRVAVIHHDKSGNITQWERRFSNQRLAEMFGDLIATMGFIERQELTALGMKMEEM